MIFLIAVIIGVLIGSIVFIENKGLDNLHQKESYLAAIKIAELADGVNPYSEFEYIKTTYFFNQEFPTLKNTIVEIPKIIPYEEKSSFTEYILQNKKNGLTHIVTDGLFASNSEMEKTLNDVFMNEGNYRYLKKVYDSSNDSFEYKVKVFEIDFSLILDN
jgi:hypothetical protein